MFQLALDIRTARLRTILDSLGAEPRVEMWSGTMPARIDEEPDGTLLAAGELPLLPFVLHENEARCEREGNWTFSCITDGLISFFRLLTNAGECKAQGDVTTNVDLRDTAPMIVDNIATRRGYAINILEFTLVEGNE